MPSCIVKSCSFSWRTRTEELILHAFPRNRDRIRKWLEQLNVPKEDLAYFSERIATAGKGIYRICSRHFKDTDYEMRGPHKVLKSTAHPTVNLENILERHTTTSYTNNRTDVEHDYYKRQRTEQAHTSRDSSTKPCLETSSDSTFSIVEIRSTSPFFQSFVTQTTECDLEETQYVDCILDKSSASGYLPAEPSSGVPISHTQIKKSKHCKICSHGLLLSRKLKVRKMHKSTQCNKTNEVRNKKIQVAVKKSKVSIGTQCSLVDLPPLCLIPIIDSSGVKIGASATSTKGIFQSSFLQDVSPKPISDPHAIKIEQDNIVSSCDYLSELNTSIGTQKKKSDNDTSYHPSHEEETFNSIQLEDDEFYVDCADPDLSFIYLPPDIGHSNMAKQKKFLVFEQCLDQLLLSSRCKSDTQCNGHITGLRKYMVGSALVVHAECSSKHKFKLWTSQPFIGRKPVGNLLISAAVLCSGSSFLKMQDFFSLLEMAAISANTHCYNQKNYLFPTIEHHWFSQRSEILEQIGPKSVALLGDGQCNASNFNVKYCTYTLLDAESHRIVDFQVKQLQASQSSVSLKHLAFVEALNRVLSDQVRVKVVATDRKFSVRKMIKERYPLIKHGFDVWHRAKSIGAKLHAASKKRNCRELSSWIPLARNHLWWASSTCQHNPILLKEKWLSIIYHSANVHEWTGNTLYHQCSHPPIPNDEPKEYKWLTPGSAAHHELKSIVQDSSLLNDLDPLSVFCHTGEIEFFHSMVLKYRSRQHNFGMDAVVARTQLAAMDYNQNVSRLLATSDPERTFHYHYNFSKENRDGVVSKIYPPTSQVFRKKIIFNAVELAAGVRNFPWKSEPDNIALLPRI